MTGSALIAEARTLIGIPYRHCGREPYGVDCAGLILLPAWRCGLTSFAPKSYSPGGDSDYLLDCLAEECVEVEEMMEPGDIGLFRLRPGRHHLAYLTGSGQIIQCSTRVGVCESRIDDRWQERCVGVWRWKALAGD